MTVAIERKVDFLSKEAISKVLAAEAEAYRLQSINENLTELTIFNTIAEGWNGQLPSVLGAGATGLFDLSGLLGGQGEAAEAGQ